MKVLALYLHDPAGSWPPGTPEGELPPEVAARSQFPKLWTETQPDSTAAEQEPEQGAAPAPARGARSGEAPVSEAIRLNEEQVAKLEDESFPARMARARAVKARKAKAEAAQAPVEKRTQKPKK